jgi:hypothetical protein
VLSVEAMDRLRTEVPKMFEAAVAAVKREWAARPEFVLIGMVVVSSRFHLVSQCALALRADHGGVDRQTLGTCRFCHLDRRAVAGACSHPNS